MMVLHDWVRRCISITVIMLCIVSATCSPRVREVDHGVHGDEQPVPGGGVTVTVDVADQKGKLSSIYRASTAPNCKRDSQNWRKFLREMKVDLVRFFAVGFRDRKIKQYPRYIYPWWDGIFGDAIQAGGDGIICLSGIPKWLASTDSREKVYEDALPDYQASPPKNYERWADLVEEVVRHFNVEKGFDLYYEIWNEPNIILSWRSTEEEYLKLYRYTVLGARRADPQARVGGPACLGWAAVMLSTSQARASGQSPSEDKLEDSIIYRLIRYCSQTPLPELGLDRLPLDFISWHAYGSPNHTFSVNTIRSWLKEFGYDPNTPLFVDEWNLYINAALKDPAARIVEGERTPAHLIHTLCQMAEAGVDRQCYFELIDMPPPKDARGSRWEREFWGRFGLFTRSGIVKPAYNAFRMVSELGEEEVAVRVKGEVPLVAVATAGKREADLLLAYYPVSVEPIVRAMDYLRRSELDRERMQELGVSSQELKEIVAGKREMGRVALTTEERAELAKAQELYRSDQEWKPVEVGIRFDNLPPGSRWRMERYLIDAHHSNCFAVRDEIRTRMERAGEAATEKAMAVLRKGGMSEAEISKLQQKRGKGMTDRQRRLVAHARQIRRQTIKEALQDVKQMDRVGLQSVEVGEIEGEKANPYRFSMEPYAVVLISLARR
jgi:hypothetical protein